MDRPVRSTYRLQLRGDCFTFADALPLVDYLDELGVSHLYLSPILTATDGSTHGYDVTDPTTVSAALGGPDGLAALAAAAHARGLGIVVDIVPNHLGVESPRQNPWWWELLRGGRDSAQAGTFDVDWELDPGGRIVLPVLGSDGDVADLQVDESGDEAVLRLGDLEFPVAPGTEGGSGEDVHARQHYRLTGWRTSPCGYRRFFSITSLAGLRQEDRAVFDATHAEPARWVREGLVDGLRIDHPDGLSRPAEYLQWLRETVGPDTWIVIEKILAVDEALDASLPVAGTTGYDALREAGGVLLDPSGADALGVISAPVHDGLALKAAAVTDTLASELARLRRAVVAAVGTDHPDLPEVIAALLARVPVYRSDYPALAVVLPVALADTTRDAPHLADALAVLAAAVAADGEAAVRLQQLCGAATAKSMEDCLFYRDARLVSLNEVGGEPEHFGVGVAEFHARAAARARLWPQAMTTLTTHDTKRGEDVRARIGVLSQVPELWADFVATPGARDGAPDPATALFLLQNVFGVWPLDGVVTDALRERLHAYAEKTIREAGTHTTWNDPGEAFETAVHTWLDAVLDGPVATALSELVARLDPAGRSDALAQKLLVLAGPGVPDVYQGTELWEDSLVDPDNRRPVDYAARRDALRAGEHPKIRVVTAALRLRRDRPGTFDGGYAPVAATGDAAAHLLGFTRGDDVLVAVTRLPLRLAERGGWADTAVALPEGTWTDRLSGASWHGSVAAADLFADLPVALLERTTDTTGKGTHA